MALQENLLVDLPVQTSQAVSALQVWLLSSGIRIGIIVLASLLFHFVIVAAGSRMLRMTALARSGRSTAGRENRLKTLNGVLARSTGAVLVLIALLMILIEVGINVAPLLTGAGILGIAIGFGAQDMIKNLTHGIFILLEDQYSEGDVVRVAGIAGVVEHFDLRRTVLRDLDGIQHHVPNGEINTASNMTKFWSGIHLELGVSYDSDLRLVRQVIDSTGLALQLENPDDVLEPPQTLGVESFADSAIIMKIVGRTLPGRQWEMSRVYRERLKEAFDFAGIEIPYPHQVEIHRDQAA